MEESNLGRVRGLGFYGSTSTSTTEIPKNTVQIEKYAPLVEDTIVNANGDLCKVDAVTATSYTVHKYGSIRGKDGEDTEHMPVIFSLTEKGLLHIEERIS